MVKASYDPVIARVSQPLTWKGSVMIEWFGYKETNLNRGLDEKIPKDLQVMWNTL